MVKHGKDTKKQGEKLISTPLLVVTVKSPLKMVLSEM